MSFRVNYAQRWISQMEFSNSPIAGVERSTRNGARKRKLKYFRKQFRSSANYLSCWEVARSKVEGEQSSRPVEGEDQTSNKFAKHSDVKWNFTPSNILFSNNFFCFFPLLWQQQNGEKFFLREGMEGRGQCQFSVTMALLFNKLSAIVLNEMSLRRRIWRRRCKPCRLIDISRSRLPKIFLPSQGF